MTPLKYMPSSLRDLHVYFLSLCHQPMAFFVFPIQRRTNSLPTSYYEKTKKMLDKRYSLRVKNILWNCKDLANNFFL